MNKLIDGKAISKEIKQKLKEEVSLLKRKPTLVVISVGNNAASEIYVHQKEKVAKDIGYNFIHLAYDSVLEKDLIKKINTLNNDTNVDGIIVQLPLPESLNSNRIINSIDSDKDVDGLTYINAGKLLNKEPCLVSCTPMGIMYLFQHEHISLEGKNVVVIGRSNLVGKPLFNLLNNANATVTLCHSKTRDVSMYTREADIVIIAIGQKGFLTKDMLKEGSIVIDVGINRVNDKIYGDVDFDNCLDKVSKITPVPGGVGPMTVIMLMQNVLLAYQKKEN